MAVKKGVKSPFFAVSWVLGGRSVKVARYSMHLLGPFRLACDGVRVDVSGRRAQALLAMLAASDNGERTRAWLQDRLWGSRPTAQAQTSLRRELSSLRKLVNGAGKELLGADHLRVWLDRELLTTDLGQPCHAATGEFLEGIDLPGEEGFEDWLRQQRAHYARSGAQSIQAVQAAPGPAAVNLLSTLALGEIDGSDEARDFLAERFARIRWLGLLAESDTVAARFELTGKVRSQGAGSSSLSLTLADRTSGRVMWSGRFDLADFFNPKSAALDAAVCAVRTRIAQAEQASAVAADILDQAGIIWRSQWHMHRLTREDAARAADYAQQAFRTDPFGAEPIAQMTWTKLWDLWVTRADVGAIRAVREQAQKAIIADHEDARGHMLAGIAEIWLMQPLRAEALLRRAVELDPSLIMARVQLACALYHRLALHEAEAELNRALALSPNDQYLFFIAGELATVGLMQSKWEQALAHAEQALAARRAYVHGHVAKVNALVRLGRIDDARAASDDLYRANPRYNPKFVDWIPFLDSTWNEFLKEGLNHAAARHD